MNKSLNILVVFDTPFATQDANKIIAYLKKHDYEDELDIIKTLKNLGHTVELFGLNQHPDHLIQKITTQRPHVIFNMIESLSGERHYEPYFPALFELLEVPYTGANPHTLDCCKNKVHVKSILKQLHVPTPQYKELPLIDQKIPLPVIIKPTKSEASEGISYQSILKTPNQLSKKLAKVETEESDYFLEEFIEGHEVYIGALGTPKKHEIFTPVVLTPYQIGKQSLVATFHLKWNKKFRKKWSIQSREYKPSPSTLKALKNAVHLTIEALELKGYFRFDFRVDSQGVPHLLEVNPNPGMSRNDEFAKSARYSGLSFTDLVKKILSQSFL